MIADTTQGVVVSGALAAQSSTERGHWEDDARPRLSREAAIVSARQRYRALVDKTLSLAANDGERMFVRDLGVAWDERLSELRLSTRLDMSLSDHTARRFDFLVSAITGHLDRDSALRWCDAFPEAVADLFPPSQSTFGVQPRESQRITTSLLRSLDAA
jgi:hypothetical protein